MQSFVFSTMENEKGRKLDEMFGVRPSFLRVQPSNCLLPPKFVFYAQKIRDLIVYEDDVWMISHPRTGKCFNNSINDFYWTHNFLIIVLFPVII
jgi:hypothetical protein